MSILLPLYLWPGDGAWEPLYSAVKAHPSVNFTVIVNPNSGPGSGELPDEAFLAEVPNLNAYNNVRTVGYVKTGYAQDALDGVLAEIGTYAAWAAKANDPAMGLDGIFFDETPNEYDAAKYEYLSAVSQAVKNEAGFGDKVVDLADISVEYEKSYDEWGADTGLEALKTASIDSSKVAVIMYSVPESAMDAVVKEAQGTADWLFLTSDNQAEGYLGFSPIFANFVASLDSGAEA
ncbi:hypothetical protein K458DRAFT_408306 [Lentithecium fluviatile CBS 122367]|uniref:Uncharacterized protein n=1 Tax=Lentithecium fluviatile CBS 122367 TaxID=1168545 RepID=A0A6G1IN20_9PLEO|nr:hypothetical protein K458DRAFT_408306 [Lentithecium fluviatile CBS 122367]